MRLAGALPNTATQWQVDLSGLAPLSRPLGAMRRVGPWGSRARIR